MKNIQDQTLKTWIKYFNNQKSNFQFPSSLETEISNIINRLKNSQQLYTLEQIYSKNNINDQKSYLISLFHLDNKISDDEYQFINYFSDKEDLFKKTYAKIIPYLMRALIHYFNLLEQIFIEVHDNPSPDIDLSILDDKYTNSFFKIYLYFKSVSDMSGILDQIICTNYPVCQINELINHFSTTSEIDLKFRNFDSSIFNLFNTFILENPKAINLFLLTEKYIFLLMKNVDDLIFSEFMNIKEFCNLMMQSYIEGIFQNLYPKTKSEIIERFLNLISNLEIGPKDTEKKIFSTKNSDENERSLSLFDYKYLLINTLFNPIIQIIHSIPTCKDYLTKSNFYQYLIHYSIYCFTNSNFLQIFIQDDLNIEKEEQKVNLISSSDNFSIDFDSSSQFSLENIQIIDLANKNQSLNIPDEAKNIILIIRKLFQCNKNSKLAQCNNNSEFVSHLFAEINNFVNLTKSDEGINEIYDILFIDKNRTIDKKSLLAASILIFCEIVLNYEDNDNLCLILHNFNQFKFIFDDFIFEHVNDEKIDQISIKANSNFLKFTRNSLFLALLKLSRTFLPQIVDSLSNVINGSKLSICDEIVSFLIQLIFENGPLLSNFNASLYAVPLISYGSLLQGNTPETKRFFYLLSNLLNHSTTCNKLFENKLFVNFIFSKVYSSEFTDFVIKLLKSLNRIESEKAIINITEYLLIDSFKLLMDSIEKKDERIEKIEKTFNYVIELFYFHYYYHNKSSLIAIEKTNLLYYIDQCLTVFYSNNQIFSIFQLIYSLQYYSDKEGSINESTNNNTKLNTIYQKDYPIYSKIGINKNIKKILINFAFGFKFKQSFEPFKSNDRKIIPIRCAESLWMVHNITKHDREYHDFYFDCINFVVENLFSNQIILSNSNFLQNCLNFICKENSNIHENEKNIFSKIVSHVLIWDFPSNLFLPSISFNKSNFLNLLKNCISKESYNFPSNFAYLSKNYGSEGIDFGPYTNSFSYNFTLSFSFRFESVLLKENEEFVLFNDKKDRFSIRITTQKTMQFYQKDSIVLNGDTVNNFIVQEKEWHRIVISANYSKVFVAVDGKNAFPSNPSINVGFLSTNFAFCVGQKFEGLICDIQVLNPVNYSDSDVLKFSTCNISNEERMRNSIACFRPFIDSEKNKNLFFDSKKPKHQYFYEGDIVLEKSSLFKQLDENDLILCMFSNLNDSEILRKSLKILLRLLSIDNNITSLIFPDDNSFLRFVFLLNDQITLFNDEIFDLCYKLFDKIEMINMKRIFVSEFLFNLNVWKSNFIKIYNRLIMSILPNIIESANSNSNTIQNVSSLSILNVIEKEESNLKRSLLFEILFSFLHKYLSLSKNKNKESRADFKPLILSKIQNYLDDSYNIKHDSLNMKLFEEELNDLSNIEGKHALIEIIKYIEKGNEKTVACFILRLFGLIQTQANTTLILDMIDPIFKNIIFKRYLSIFFSSESNRDLFVVDSNSFFKLTSYVTHKLDSQNNSIGILFAVFISASQLIKEIDLSTLFDIYESISSSSISNQNENCQAFFFFWSILLFSASNEEYEDFSNKVIQLLVKKQKKETISSFVWLFYLFCINSDRFGFKKWKSFVDKLIELVLSSLKSSLNHQKKTNYLIHIFIDLIITLSLIKDDENEVCDKLNNESNLLYLMDLVRSEQSFKIFNSFGLDKIKNGLNSYLDEISQFFAILDQIERVTYDCDLICFITLVTCSNSKPEQNDFNHHFTSILTKMDLNTSFSFEIIGKLFKQLEVPAELVQEMKRSFPNFSMVEQSSQIEGEISELTQNSDDESEKVENNENLNENENNQNSQVNNCEYDLIKILILRFLMNLLNNVLIVSSYYVKFDLGKVNLDSDTSLRNLCSIEKSKFYLRSFQIQAQQSSDGQNDLERPNFVVFNTSFIPILLTNKDPFIGIIEIEDDFISEAKANVNSSIVMENVYFVFQGTKKKCHFFYDLYKFDSFMIGGLEMSNADVNFIVKHTNSSIEMFLRNGFQFIIEFTSLELTDESKEEKPIIHNLIGSFTELSISYINEKIDQKSLNLIEISILLNFLNGRSFNLPENLPLIQNVPASKFILERQDRDYFDESLKKWCQEFFNLENTVNLDSISNKPQKKISGASRCIGILTSPILFLSICHKKIFCADNDNMLRGASMILPPRVPRATIQVFNSNVLSPKDKSGNNENHFQRGKLTLSAFNVIQNNFLNTSEKVNHGNEFFVAASFGEFSCIFVYLVRMSELLLLKSFKLNDKVKFISPTSKNCFVFITNNSNKVHLIKIISCSNKNSEIEHGFFVSHSSDVTFVSSSQNMIVSIDFERKVCLTLIDSLQTVASFSVECIPKLVLITNSPCFRLVALYENENRIVSFDFNGRIVWEYERSNKNEKITKLVLLKDKMNSNFDLFIALLINNNVIECRSLNETQLIKNKKGESDQKMMISDAEFKLLLSVDSEDKIYHIKYDEELDILGYIDDENNLNGLFFDYLSDKK